MMRVVADTLCRGGVAANGAPRLAHSKKFPSAGFGDLVRPVPAGSV